MRSEIGGRTGFIEQTVRQKMNRTDFMENVRAIIKEAMA